MPVYSLVYTSRATPAVNGETLAELLTTCRTKNEERAVSGVLLYALGCYVQELEGDEATVEGVLERVRHDERHSDVVVLGRERVADRTFQSWSMGLLRPDARQLAQAVPDLRDTTGAPGAPGAGLWPGVRTADDLLGRLETAAAARRLLRSGPPELYPAKIGTRRDWVPFQA